MCVSLSYTKQTFSLSILSYFSDDIKTFKLFSGWRILCGGGGGEGEITGVDVLHIDGVFFCIKVWLNSWSQFSSSGNIESTTSECNKDLALTLS